MNELKRFLDKREKEIEQYFLFLNLLNIDRNTDGYTISALGSHADDESILELTTPQVQMFKSNCFLLLYNAIEGTVNKSLEFIIDKINDDEDVLTQKDVIEEIKEIWLKYSLLENGNIYEIDSKLIRHIEEYIDKKIDIDLKHFKKENKGYFGTSNLTDDVIHSDVLPKVGINKDKIIESTLKDIKKFRNSLAHGSSSFVDMGSTKTFKEIQDYKNKAFKYLDKYVDMVSEFIDKKEYKL